MPYLGFNISSVSSSQKIIDVGNLKELEIYMKEWRSPENIT
jgi:hypothetical protein